MHMKAIASAVKYSYQRGILGNGHSILKTDIKMFTFLKLKSH